jgi:hypothetical protein
MGKQARIAELESMHRILISMLEETKDNKRRLELTEEIREISDELGKLKGHKKINKEEYQINIDIQSTEASFPEYAPMSSTDIEEARRKLGIEVGNEAYIGKGFYSKETTASHQDGTTPIKSHSAFKRFYLYIRKLFDHGAKRQGH